MSSRGIQWTEYALGKYHRLHSTLLPLLGTEVTEKIIPRHWGNGGGQVWIAIWVLKFIRLNLIEKYKH